MVRTQAARGGDDSARMNDRVPGMTSPRMRRFRNALLRRYANAVQRELDRLLPANALPAVYEEAIRGALARGKKMRPIVALCCAEIGGSKFKRAALKLAVALELVHVSSLVLDDVIDRSQTRRGSPTTHAKYGLDVAIVSAGMLILRGFRDLAERRRIRATGYDALMRLLLGQAIDTKGDVKTERQYLRMVGLKTASLFEAAAVLGAASSETGRRTTEKLRHYGKNLGIAFQLRDDVLDFIGSKAKLGKPVGQDVSGGKRTIVTMKISRALGISPRRLARLGMGLLRRRAAEAGVLAHAERLTRRFAERAALALSGIPSSPAKSLLEHFAVTAPTRDR